MTREHGHVAAEDLISRHRVPFRPAPAHHEFGRAPNRAAVAPGRPAGRALPSLRRVVVRARPVAATIAVLACLGPFGAPGPALGDPASPVGPPSATFVSADEAGPIAVAGPPGSLDTGSTAAAAGAGKDRAGDTRRVSRSTRRAAPSGVRDRSRPARKPVAARRPGQIVPGSWRKPNSGPMTSCFCLRWGTMHEGIDLAGPLGSPILAVGAGTVLQAGPQSGFGNWVVIRHANGDVSIYGHMRFFFVHAGEHVAAGQKIALVGSEGQSTGPHLHFEIHRGGFTGPPIDPVPWLKARGIRVGPYDPNG